MIKDILVYSLIHQVILVITFFIALKIQKWIFSYDPPSYISMPIVVAPAVLFYLAVITPLMLFKGTQKDGAAYIGILISLNISFIAMLIFGFIKLRRFMKDQKAWQAKKKAEREAELKAHQEELNAADELYTAVKGIKSEGGTG